MEGTKDNPYSVYPEITEELMAGSSFPFPKTPKDCIAPLARMTSPRPKLPGRILSTVYISKNWYPPQVRSDYGPGYYSERFALDPEELPKPYGGGRAFGKTYAAEAFAVEDDQEELRYRRSKRQARRQPKVDDTGTAGVILGEEDTTPGIKAPPATEVEAEREVEASFGHDNPARLPGTRLREGASSRRQTAKAELLASVVAEAENSPPKISTQPRQRISNRIEKHTSLVMPEYRGLTKKGLPSTPNRRFRSSAVISAPKQAIRRSTRSHSSVSYVE